MSLRHYVQLFTLTALFSQSAFAHNDHLQRRETQQNVWSRITQPLAGHPEAIGSYTNGCQIGAQALPETGTGYVSIRRWRNRFYTQPVTLKLIATVGQTVARHGERILVGDSSQAIGGKMPYGHSSHQNGLDVDFWFYTVPQSALPDPNLKPPTMVAFKEGLLQSALWRASYRDALYAAATYPETTRIFVNPVIKLYLCETERERAWLNKVRPWVGHDAHFHVRLECPADSLQCERQAPVPAGDGCDDALRQWVAQQTHDANFPKPARPKAPKMPKPLPLACQIVLEQAQAL